MNAIYLVVAACGLVLLAACTSNRQYRTSFAPCDTTKIGSNCTEAVIETTDHYKLGFVEFDDQGWFWDRRQLEAVQRMIEAEAKFDAGDEAGVVIVLFVHGWKNNAAHDNENVGMFRHTLEQLDIAENAEAGLENRRVRKLVGVYAGWRGLSARLEPFKELSFYERKNTAHKIGYGAVTELLVRLEGLQTASNKRLAHRDAPRTELIIVGHSFGGAVVYSAISQIATERFLAAIGQRDRPLKPFGDLVILLNPAFEASRYYNLNELATTAVQYPPNQRPVLAIFTSKADWATRYFLPLGRFFSTLFEKHRSDKPQKAEISKRWGISGHSSRMTSCTMRR